MFKRYNYNICIYALISYRNMWCWDSGWISLFRYNLKLKINRSETALFFINIFVEFVRPPAPAPAPPPPPPPPTCPSCPTTPAPPPSELQCPACTCIPLFYDSDGYLKPDEQSNYSCSKAHASVRYLAFLEHLIIIRVPSHAQLNVLLTVVTLTTAVIHLHLQQQQQQSSVSHLLPELSWTMVNLRQCLNYKLGTECKQVSIWGSFPFSKLNFKTYQSQHMRLLWVKI